MNNLTTYSMRRRNSMSASLDGRLPPAVAVYARALVLSGQKTIIEMYFHMGYRNIGRIVHMRKNVYIPIYVTSFDRILLQVSIHKSEKAYATL